MGDFENGTDEVKGERTPTSSKILKGPPTDTISTEDSLEQKISLRMEIMLKKERMKQEEEANFTYKPKLFTSPTNKSKDKSRPEDPNTRENRFDKLYSDALKRHISHTTKEEQKDKDLTFTPKVTKRAGSASRSNSATRGNGSRSASRERSSVASDAPSDGRRTPTSRKSIEPEKPTFQPAISKRAKSIERARDKEVADRLYEHGLHLKEKMERKRVENEQKQLESCSFAPKITDNKRSSSASRVDVVERMNKFDEIRKKKLQEAMEQKKEQENNLSFKPTLMAKRSSTPTQLPFHERLAVPQEKTVSHAAMEAMSHLTFKPQLISKRTPSPNTTRSSSEFKSIHERLFREGVEHKQELENELRNKRHELDAELTFQPQLMNPSPRYSHEPVFDRLNAAADRQDVKAKLNRIRSEVTKDWTFQPNISENSKKLVGQRRDSSEYSLYERSLAEQRRLDEELQRKKEEQEQERLREATFAPSLPESSKELAKKKLSMERMDSTDVYSRLLTSPTAASLHEHQSMTVSQVDPNLSRSIILPEKVLTQVFERLATPSVQQMEQYLSQPEQQQRKVVVPEKEAEEIFNRLSAKKTMSFTFKTHETEHHKPHNGSHSPSSKQPLTEETLMARLEQAHHQKSRAGRENSSQVSSITGGSNASKSKKATTPSGKATVTPNKSGVQRSASKDSVTKLPAPPSSAKDNFSSPVVMPPAPPATAVKGATAGGPVDYQDFAKKLEASLDMINQGSNNDKRREEQTQKKSAKKSPKKPNKDSEFIKSIPTVPDNGELSD